MFLKNKHIDDLYCILALLIKTKCYAIDNESFYNKTDITVRDIDKCIERINKIIASDTASKIINNEKSNKYNKTHKEYHRITNNMHEAKKNGNIERYNYWRQKRDQLKKSK